MRLKLFAVILLACAANCARTSVTSRPTSRLAWEEVLRLRRTRDYFALRDRLAADGDSTTTPALFARALVQHAFNAPAESNATIGALLATANLPDSLATELRRVEMANDLRLFQYASGLAIADTLLAKSEGLDSASVRDVRNTQRVFRVLATAAPQTVQIRGPTTLRLEHGRVPVQVNDSVRSYAFDTGANLSTLMRSEAVALGLKILPAGIELGTSTDRRVTADLAVADRLTIGAVHYRQVVFLVLDDSLLTFAGGFRIPGLIGFPVIEQMVEVRLGRDGQLSVPERAPPRAQRNVALDELTPLVRVRVHDAPLLCRLDTGAGKTDFYEPFYRRFQMWIDTTARRATRRMGSAGGIREMEVRVLPSIRLSLGDTVATLDSVPVLPHSIVANATENYLDCNIGRDVLGAFPRYVLNFRDMAFVLR
jgi:hypothetical protein